MSHLPFTDVGFSVVKLGRSCTGLNSVVVSSRSYYKDKRNYCLLLKQREPAYGLSPCNNIYH